MSSISLKASVSLGTLRRSARHVLAYPILIAGTFVSLAIGSGLAVAGPLVVRRLIDDGVSKQDPSLLAALAGLFLLVEALRTLAETSQTFLLRKLAQATTGSLRREVFGQIQRVPLSWIESTPAARIVARSTGDVSALGEAVSGGLIGLGRDLLVFAAVGALVLCLHPRFGSVTLASALIVGIPAMLIRRSAQGKASQAQDSAARMNAVLEENVAGHAVIQLFGIASARGDLFRRENLGLVDVSLSTLRMRVFYDAGATVISALALTFIIGLGGAELGAGRLSLGLLVAFVQYGSYLLGAVRGTAEKFVSIFAGLAAGERVFETLDLPAALEPPTPAGRAVRPEKGLVLSKLRFGYCPGVEVLKGLDASILPGEHVALVGKSGAGKSTLARLIARLYDPWEGEIRWEGHDLRDVPLPELRRKVGLLTQRVSIFRDTVLENVRLWAPGVDRRKAIEACYAVGAHRFIEGLPKGYDTSLTPGGKELSAGERQLIAYARVLVQRPELLVLDEPTANVDQDTEQRILDATAKVMAGRTVILIAHRLSTLRAAERVWFMDEGKLVEDGTPGELLAHSSQFRRMADRYRAAADWQERSAAHGE